MMRNIGIFLLSLSLIIIGLLVQIEINPLVCIFIPFLLTATFLYPQKPIIMKADSEEECECEAQETKKRGRNLNNGTIIMVLIILTSLAFLITSMGVTAGARHHHKIQVPSSRQGEARQVSTERGLACGYMKESYDDIKTIKTGFMQDNCSRGRNFLGYATGVVGACKAHNTCAIELHDYKNETRQLFNVYDFISIFCLIDQPRVKTYNNYTFTRRPHEILLNNPHNQVTALSIEAAQTIKTYIKSIEIAASQAC